jgi:5-methylcytosine-specific restriction endonuclease McrA
MRPLQSPQWLKPLIVMPYCLTCGDYRYLPPSEKACPICGEPFVRVIAREALRLEARMKREEAERRAREERMAIEAEERFREEERRRREAEDDLIRQAKERFAERKRAAEVAWAQRIMDDQEPPNREHIPAAVRQAVLDGDGGRCRECGAASDLQIDHIIPVRLGGSSSIKNLQVLCGPCNLRKGPTVG